MVGCAAVVSCGSSEEPAQPLKSVTRLPDPIDVAATAGGDLRVLYLGDSITRGSGAATYADSFREVATATMKQALATDDHSVAKGGARLAQVAAMATPVVPAELVVIELGTNDLLAPPTPIDEFRRQYRDLIGAVRAVNPSAAVVCMGVWRPPSKAEPYDSVIADECGSARSRYLPLSDLFQDTQLRGPAGREALGTNGEGDDFHPNDRGHSAIANRLLGVLQLAGNSSGP
ncbi:SGNH/GDSL hydrolase family protein [Gordonia jinghuaiqii]|uniref:SGNH/GDSL hydrolase family protein n=1 Tax=Gordonia jinghuaiqii TaxID=2758710 RepID=A0A7D7QR64_9ACTN|nr:SGNH/GDSL hydrolase family protein [Gordonia jinghuaiqii]QMT02586.1 SGNH/GDSL hydrolase family protein [Gordonia jinghuaiqii]